MRKYLWLAITLFFSFFLNGFSAASAQERPLTAREVVQRIQEHVGVPWQKETVDTFKAGDPDTKVTGIAVTMMATFDVLQRAAASGANLIITHEPTFYNHLDDLKEIPQKENDPVLAEKLAFIKEHHLAVWRFHDHWHKRTPDGTLVKHSSSRSDHQTLEIVVVSVCSTTAGVTGPCAGSVNSLAHIPS